MIHVHILLFGYKYWVPSYIYQNPSLVLPFWRCLRRLFHYLLTFHTVLRIPKHPERNVFWNLCPCLVHPVLQLKSFPLGIRRL